MGKHPLDFEILLNATKKLECDDSEKRSLILEFMGEGLNKNDLFKGYDIVFRDKLRLRKQGEL
jgi:hypothetical protein